MKHKKLVITFSIIGGIILAIGGSYLGFMINGSAPEYKEDAPAQRADWMNDIQDDALLSNIVIPGSHDAMTDGMHFMACCQNANMEESLAMGVRYFDFRVNKANGTLKIYHSIINGVELKPCLESASEFLLAHPSETLILDFQHFSNDAQEDTYQMIHDVFDTSNLIANDDKELSDQNYVASLSLGDARGKALCLWGDYSRGNLADSKNDLFPRDNDGCSYGDTACQSYYNADLHKKSSEEFISESLPEQFSLAEQAKEKGKLGLFVLQSQLTDGKLIFGPYAREKEHDANMSKAVKEIALSSHLAITNIIMRDFVNVRKCGEIIRLNQEKGILKESAKANFEVSYSIYA